MKDNAQSDSGLDIPTVHGSCLCDSDVKRIINLLCYQFICSGTHENIRGFDADRQIVIVECLDHTDFVNSTLHQSLGRHSVILFHQLFFQRAAVDAYTDRNAILFGFFNDCPDTVFSSDIARIDANFIGAVLHSRDGELIVEMYIRHQRNVNPFFDLTQGIRCFRSRDRASYDITSGFLKA